MRFPSRSDVTFGLLVAWSVAASGITGIATWQRLGGGQRRSSAVGRPADVKEWRQFVPEPMRARLTAHEPAIIVFADFQCPYCRRFASTLDSLRERQPSLLIAERHFPLIQLHPQALDAALAAECARESRREDQMRSVLYERRELVALGEWTALGALAGLPDTAGLRACVAGRRTASAVEADVNAGRMLGITATPTFLLGDSLFTGAMTLPELEARLATYRRTH